MGRLKNLQDSKSVALLLTELMQAINKYKEGLTAAGQQGAFTAGVVSALTKNLSKEEVSLIKQAL